MAKAKQPLGEIPTEVVIEWTERDFIDIEKSATIPVPHFWRDQYGYINGTFDGKTTIQIGLNGVQCHKQGTHSLQTLAYISDSAASKKSQVLTGEQFQSALEHVYQYVLGIQQLEIMLRWNKDNPEARPIPVEKLLGPMYKKSLR